MHDPTAYQNKRDPDTNVNQVTKQSDDGTKGGNLPGNTLGPESTGASTSSASSTNQETKEVSIPTEPEVEQVKQATPKKPENLPVPDAKRARQEDPKA